MELALAWYADYLVWFSPLVEFVFPEMLCELLWYTGRGYSVSKFSVIGSVLKFRFRFGYGFLKNLVICVLFGNFLVNRC